MVDSKSEERNVQGKSGAFYCSKIDARILLKTCGVTSQRCRSRLEGVPLAKFGAISIKYMLAIINLNKQKSEL